MKAFSINRAFLLDYFGDVKEGSTMTTGGRQKKGLLLELNDGQKTALADLEKRTPESNIKRGASALLLIAERTDQI